MPTIQKHTPVRYTTPYGSREIYRDGKPFVVISRAESGEYVSPADVDAFARLIAAAPEMLDLLRKLVDHYDAGKSLPVVASDARVLLSRIEGGAK